LEDVKDASSISVNHLHSDQKTVYKKSIKIAMNISWFKNKYEILSFVKNFNIFNQNYFD